MKDISLIVLCSSYTRKIQFKAIFSKWVWPPPPTFMWRVASILNSSSNILTLECWLTGYLFFAILICHQMRIEHWRIFMIKHILEGWNKTEKPLTTTCTTGMTGKMIQLIHSSQTNEKQRSEWDRISVCIHSFSFVYDREQVKIRLLRKIILI